MSTKGAERDSSPSLISLIQSGKEKEVKEAIKKGNLDLNEVHPLGYHPIHAVAARGMLKAFKALIQAGISPYALDKNGLAPYHYAAQNPKLRAQLKPGIANPVLEYFDNELPLEIEDSPDRLSQEINNNLRHIGLQAYTIQENQNAKGSDYILNLFTPYTQPVEKKRAKSSKPNLMASLALQINPMQLTRIAHGIAEEMSPLDMMKAIVSNYKNFEHKAKLAAIYLVKEFVLLDTDLEWVSEPEFEKLLIAFINNLGHTAGMATVKVNMKKMLALTPKGIAFDLAKLFTTATLKVTPKSFLNFSIKTNTQDSAFAELTALMNQVTDLVKDEILLAPTHKESTEKFNLYYETLKRCLNEHELEKDEMPLPFNMAAALAIFGALASGAVSRLTDIQDHTESRYSLDLARIQSMLAPNDLYSLMVRTKQCIPSLAVYSGLKAQKDENVKGVNDRVLAFGKYNEEFSKIRQYLLSLSHLTQAPFKTHFFKKLEGTHLTDDEQYWYSFQLLPARVIDLNDLFKSDKTTKQDPTPSLIQGLIAKIKHCKNVDSPLAVRAKSDELYKNEEAKSKLLEVLNTLSVSATDRAEISKICDEVIENSRKKMPARLKLAKVQREDSYHFVRRLELPEVIQGIAALDIKDEHEIAPRPRASSSASVMHKERRKTEKSSKRNNEDSKAPNNENAVTYTPLATLYVKSKKDSATTDVPSSSSSSTLTPFK